MRPMTVRKESDGKRRRSRVAWQEEILAPLLGDERVDKIEMSKVSNILSVQGKHRQAVSTESCRSGSESSSSGECEDEVLAYKAQWA